VGGSVASGHDDGGRASIVVTTQVLGSLVSELVGDEAAVTVLMEAGVDPHTWQPSARDSEAIFEADLVVANGGGLEEGLGSVLDQAEAQGVPVFRAVDHLTASEPTVDASHEATSLPSARAAEDDEHD